MTIPSTMQAMVLTGHGGPEQLKYQEVTVPTPSDDAVLIKVGACGLNNTDINTRTAWYSEPVQDEVGEGSETGFDDANNTDASWGGHALPLPLIQGADVCGHIVAASDQDRVGERVLVDPWILDPNQWCNPQTACYLGSEINGGFAEYVVVPALNAITVDSPLSNAELATFPCAYTTAYHTLNRANLKHGETVVITGASGGVGSAALQLAALKECRIIALTSAHKQASILELGASVVVDRCSDNIEAEIRAVAPNGVDVVIDTVAGDLLMPLLRTLRQGGRYSSCGSIAGAITTIDLRQMVYRDLQLTGATICPPGTMQAIVALIEQGQLKPLLAAQYALSELVQAQAAFVEKQHVGNIVVQPLTQ